MFNKLRDKFSSFSLTLSSSPNHLEIWQWITLGALIFFACFYGMSSYAILDMNEGLYAEVAQEMLLAHHWIIPHLNGVPYLEKPPLFYWLLAISYKVFGANAFGARFVPSLFLAFTGLSVLMVGKKLGAIRTGFIAAFILFSSLIFVMIGRTVFFDMLLTFFISGSLFSFYFWMVEKNTKALYLGYGFLALAILTKGFLALILVPLVLFVYLFLMKSSKSSYAELFDKKALLIFIAIVLPWHLLAIFHLPAFTWEYFINNQVLRFFDARVPDDYHTGPFYFYIPRVMAYLMPWAIFLPALFWPFRLQRPFDPFKAFLWTWFLVMFVFFSLSGDKGDYYMVVGIVPLAYLIAQKIEGWISEAYGRWLTLGFYGLTLALIGGGIIALLFYQSPSTDYVAQFSGDVIPSVLNSTLIFTVLFLILYVMAGFYFIRKNPTVTMLPFLLITGLIIPLLMLYLTVREKTQFLYSQISVGKYILAQYEHRPLYLYHDFEAISSLVFYNREPAIIVDSQSSDLYFGSHTKEAAGKFVSLADFLAQAKKEKVYIAMKLKVLEAFQKEAGGKDFCVIQRNGNVILLSNSMQDCQASIQNEMGVQKVLDVEKFNIGKTPAEMPKEKPQ